jgi:small subunit ribosomal protein S14
MASNRMTRREKKRILYEGRKRAVRKKLRAQLNDPSLDLEQKLGIQAKFEKMPRDTAAVRISNRCKITGRAHGVYRKFGICRNMIRILAMEGKLPGVVKSSW